MSEISQYNISSRLAELINKYQSEFDYIEITFVSKHKNKTQSRPNQQNIFFVDKDGKMLNGEK